MTTGRISKTTVDALSCPPEKDRDILWDDKLKGFGVAVFPTGRKVYVAQYRKGGRSHRVTIGRHGRLTPDQARREALKLLGDIERGSNPAEERRAQREAPTLKEVAEEFVAYVRAKKKVGTGNGYESALRLHILPRLGSRRITDIQQIDMERLHSTMSGRPYQANRTIAIFSALWTWAGAKRKLVSLSDNPAVGLEKNREEKRKRYLTGAELARFGDALRAAETIGLPYTVDEAGPKAKHAAKPENRRRKIDVFAVAAIRLLMLTGARLREILHAKWEFVDLDRGMVFLPDSKTGEKTIYLSAASAEILSSLPRMKDNPYIFPGERAGKPRTDLKKPWAAICTVAGLEGVRLHDLRHSFASVGAGASLGLPIIGKLLGHSQTTTTARYAHLDADPMRRAVDMIGAAISAAMDEAPKKKKKRYGGRRGDSAPK